MRAVSSLVHVFCLAFALTLALAASGLAAPASAQNVLVVRVVGGTAYYDPLTTLAADIMRETGATVTEVSVGATGALPPLTGFEQVWWLDFSTGSDNSSNLLAAANAVAAWSAGRTNPNQAIIDGRMISSLWTSGTTSSVGIERALIRNYMRSMSELGGGVVVGTDHDAFIAGANLLLSRMGFGGVTGIYYTPPYRAVVDATHSLWARPETAWHACTGPGCVAGTPYIRDDSSSSIMPAGLQTNGRTLYTVAWHGTTSGSAAVVSTFRSAPTALAGRITAPADAASYTAFSTAPVTLTATASGGNGTYTYTWTTSAGTTIAPGATTTLPSTAVSPQTITLTVRDSDGRTVTDTIVIYSGFCSSAAACPSGRSCVDGVCCDAACGGGATNDCQACSIAAGGTVDGTCGALRAAVAPTVTCRGSAGTCDLAEVCAAGSTTCPANVRVAVGTTCRPSGGTCDVAETCDGSDVCPADARVSPGVVCRAAAGSCDLAEVCDGSAVCPADLRLAAGTMCRGSLGVCDVAELCDGSALCPADARVAAGTECRASAGVCDVAEACDGAVSCPDDARVAPGTECRASGGDCDVAEACDGSAACPDDTRVAPGTECRASGGVCDVVEACDGSATCPAEGFVAIGTECRASGSTCDAPESCTGDAATCPSDAPVGDGTSCSDSVACNGAETCVAGACEAGAAIECDDGDACTAESCTEPDGACEHAPVAGCCNVADDCDDGDSCTTDACSGAGGTCDHDAVAECCHDVDDCDDGDACTTDACDAEVCSHTTAAVCIDAGTPDSGARDASVTADAGVRDASVTGDAATLPPSTEGGCACRTGSRSATPATLGLALVLAVTLVARRRLASSARVTSPARRGLR